MKSSARLLILVFALLALLATPAAEAVPPVITVDNTSAEATGPEGATVNYTVAVTADPGPYTVDCAPPPGSTFALGSTSASCTATDTTSGEQNMLPFSVTVNDTTAPVVTVPGGVTAEAAGPGGAAASYSASASDTVSGSLTPSCSPPSGSTFPLGGTLVTCTATDGAGNSGSGSFTVTIQDTTPPVVTVPAGPTVQATGPTTPVTYTGVSATDTVSGSLTPSCSPPSGSGFAVGATTVTCTATDGAGNSGSGSFTVTVQDQTPPVVTVPGAITAEATGPAGASVSYSGVSAIDNVSGNLTPSCSPAPGSTFPLGPTTVNCTATDGSGNNGSNNFTVTVRDTTRPVVTVPSGQTAEATGPSGASVSYSGVSATDTVSGSLTPGCSPASGSTLPLGATTVTCTASDGAGNSGSGSFTVTVQDTSGPGFGDAPADIVVEASGPKGSLVKFAIPTAVDAVDGPVPTTCGPPSGATFSLGATRVDCSAKDQRGNERAISFVITVADRTAPVLTVPAPLTVSSAGAENLPATAAAVAAFLSSAVASDLVDGKLPVKVEAPAVFGIGKTTVKFSSADKAGNSVTLPSSITVVKEAVAPTKPLDRTPPDNVRGLSAKAGDRSVTLSWRPPPDPDFQHVVISRAAQGASADTAVYKGPAKKFVDRRLTNGVAYRYVVISYDQAGNRSAGVAVVAAPKALMLVSPTNGARVKAPPLLRWVRIPGATYYNVQLFRGTGRVKIFTTWPGTNHLQLRSTWIHERRRQRLIPGVYRWFVWPGFGRQIAKNYGPLLGESSFTVVAGKKK
jgi:large repetitive protein